MTAVVLLRGVNVGGHRVFRPTTLVAKLKHLDMINIGAAGTFVIRQPIAHTELRAEIAKLLPFDAEIVIRPGSEFLRMRPPRAFTNSAPSADVVRFISVTTSTPPRRPRLPLQLPSDGAWLVQLAGRQGRLVFGQYRRHMKTIRYLGEIDQLLGVAVTTRNWNTVKAIVHALSSGTA